MTHPKLIFQKDNIGIGKRKKASATVFLVPGSGTLVINKIPGELYLQSRKKIIKQKKIIA